MEKVLRNTKKRRDMINRVQHLAEQLGIPVAVDLRTMCYAELGLWSIKLELEVMRRNENR